MVRTHTQRRFRPTRNLAKRVDGRLPALPPWVTAAGKNKAGQPTGAQAQPPVRQRIIGSRRKPRVHQGAAAGAAAANRNNPNFSGGAEAPQQERPLPIATIPIFRSAAAVGAAAANRNAPSSARRPERWPIATPAFAGADGYAGRQNCRLSSQHVRRRVVRRDPALDGDGVGGRRSRGLPRRGVRWPGTTAMAITCPSRTTTATTSTTRTAM